MIKLRDDGSRGQAHGKTGTIQTAGGTVTGAVSSPVSIKHQGNFVLAIPLLKKHSREQKNLSTGQHTDAQNSYSQQSAHKYRE